MADLNRRLRANSAPARERTRGDGAPLDPSPFGGRRSDRLRTTGAADSEAVDENENDEEDVLSDEEQFIAGDAPVGGTAAALVTPVQPAAAPGAIVFPSTSPFYSSFLLQNHSINYSSAH